MAIKGKPAGRVWEKRCDEAKGDDEWLSLSLSCLKPPPVNVSALPSYSLPFSLSPSHYVLLRHIRRMYPSSPFPFVPLTPLTCLIQHRSLQPTVPPTQGPSQQPSHTRLSECFDIIRSEFDVLSQDIVHLRNQRDEFDTKGSSSNPFPTIPPTWSISHFCRPVASQVNELNIIRQSLYDLEAQHGKIRQQYEEEISRLRAELMAARQGATGIPPNLGVNVGPGASGLPTPTAGPALPYSDHFMGRPPRDPA